MTTETNKLRTELQDVNRRQYGLENSIDSCMNFILKLNKLKEQYESEGKKTPAELSLRLELRNESRSIQVPFKILTEVNIQQLTCILESIHDKLHTENKQLVEAMEVFQKLVK